MSERPSTRTIILKEHKTDKDVSGAYLPEAPRDISIDSLMLKGLQAIERTMSCVLKEANAGPPSRESIQNLKDCMAMLQVLKERETEVLEELSDEDLEKKVNGNKNL